ncbi:MAG: hypothetical protein VB144_03595 [Clostridia bacterium]|nr:hypothetical protein [Clostridia bacterium]
MLTYEVRDGQCEIVTFALRFYHKAGFRLVAVHRDAVTLARRIKPEIPLIGEDEIPICDEVELEMILDLDDGSV